MTQPISLTGETGQPHQPDNGFDRFFRIPGRGSTVSREVRGGPATFFALGYVVVASFLIHLAIAPIERLLGS